MSAETSIGQPATLLSGDGGGGDGGALSCAGGAPSSTGNVAATQQTCQDAVPAPDPATAKIKTTTPSASVPGTDASSSQPSPTTGSNATQHAASAPEVEVGDDEQEQVLENKAAAEVAVSEWVLGPGQTLVDKILEQANQPSTAGMVMACLLMSDYLFISYDVGN